MSLYAELKRRNVFRVALAYAVLGWLLLELAGIASALWQLPPWMHRFLAALLLIGFPLALVLSWIYELTPQGIRREFEVDREHSVTPRTGRWLMRLTLAGALVIITINLVRVVLT